MLIENSRHEMIPEPYIQSEAEIRAVHAGAYAAVNSLMNGLLHYLTQAPA